MNKLSAITLTILLFVLIHSCSTVPIIGRKQLSLLPESQLVTMSLTSYQSFLDSSEVITQGQHYNMVKNSGSKISAAVEKFLAENNMADRLSTFQWEFNLVKDATPNAWCMPGGKVVFYEGIMPVCMNEDGVAVVMAGYNPEEAVKFWQRMSKMGSTNMPEYLSTHPISDKRVEAIKKLIPEMEQYKP